MMAGKFYYCVIIVLVVQGVFYGIGVGADTVATMVSASGFSRPPAIDGVIHDEEWKNAALITGVMRGKTLDPRACLTWIGYDEKRVFIAVRSELPPGRRLLTRITKRGDNVVADDSIEIWLAPPKDRAEGPRRFGYFQLIVNSKGVIYDRHHEPGYGQPPKAWKVKLKNAHLLTSDGYWDAEFAIPFSEIGLSKPPAELRFLVARNFHAPHCQAPITPCQAFTARENYALLRLDRNAPVIQVRGFSRPGVFLPLALFCHNPGAKQVGILASITIDPGQGEPLKYSKTLTLNPGNSVTCMTDAGFNRADHGLITMTIKDGNGKLLYGRCLRFAPMPRRRWNNREAFLRFRHCFENADLRADYSSVGKALPLSKTADVALVPGRRNRGKALRLGRGASAVFSRRNFAIPGSISCWVCLLEKHPPKSYLRFWSSKYKSSGYIFMQLNNNHGSKVMFGAHHFSGIKHNLAISGMHPQPGEWHNIIVNLTPDKAVLYIDGVQVALKAFRRPLRAEELSDLMFGSGGCLFAIDDFEVYDRPLRKSEIKRIAMGDNPADGRICYFPSLRQVIAEATLDLQKLPPKPTLAFVVTDKDGKVMLRRDVDIAEEAKAIGPNALLLRKALDLPDLQDGVYRTFMLLGSRRRPTAQRKLFNRSFRVRHYEWVANRIGLSDIVVPPFTPLVVRKNRVSCVLRTYHLCASGFPCGIDAKGRQILAAPVKAVAVAKTGKLAWQALGLTFTGKKNTRVCYVAGARNDRLRMTVRGEFDYDGLLKLSLVLDPLNSKPLERLYLDIPVRKSIATLFHAVGEGVHSNPAGLIPGRLGTVFSSRSLPQPHLDNFIPYLWVGGEERGICYAADWDRGWTHCKERDAVELIREKDAVVIRLNLLNGPLVLKKKREIQIVLMASPVKPMPRDWRAFSDNYSRFRLPGRSFAQCLYSPLYWGAFSGWYSRYPAFKDFTYFKKLDEARRTGKVDSDYISRFLKRVENAPLQEVPWRKRGMKDVAGHIRGGFSLARRLSAVNPNSRFFVYTCTREISTNLPENEVYGDEWQYRERGQVSRSFQDYAIYYTAKMIDNGCGGIYFDNTFFAAKYTWPTGEAYIDEKNEIHPSVGLWRIRNLIKRTAVMMVEKGKEPLLLVHQTNGNTLPALAFATISMGMEMKYGQTDFQDRFTPGYIRAVNLGRQGGFFPEVLDGLRGNREHKKWLTRTMLACLLPHEIQPTAGIGTNVTVLRKAYQILWDFGKAEPDTRFLPYWNNSNSITAPADVLVSAYRRKNRLMLIIGNYGGDMKLAVTLNLSKLGVNAIREAVNAETGGKLEIRRNRVIMKLKKHDFALVQVTCR